jgi:hypothetical protein
LCPEPEIRYIVGEHLKGGRGCPTDGRVRLRLRRRSGRNWRRFYGVGMRRRDWHSGARIVLRCADGLTNKAVAGDLGVDAHPVGKWRER